MGSLIMLQPGKCYSIEDCPDVIGLDYLKRIIDGWPTIALRVPSAHFHKFIMNAKSAHNTILFCDEEGYPKTLAPTIVRPTDGHVLVGPIIICQYRPVWHEDGPDETYHPLAEDQLTAITDFFKIAGWSHIILDEIDYTADHMLDGGESGISC